ncbi:MAG: DNA repair protein RecO (recombination protein O) [Lentisphaeria bacterium]|jgi:DNA repair protein RecO (recombination protein O)
MSSMMDAEPAFLIHSRKYTDTKILVDILTARHGRVSGVLRAPISKKSLTRVQAFTPLLASWRGKAALKTFTLVEATANAYSLSSRCLFAAMYLNEVVQRLMPLEDACETLFSSYREALERLSQQNVFEENPHIEQALRLFEFSFLESLGYCIDFKSDINNVPISPQGDAQYVFIAGEGFWPLREIDEEPMTNATVNNVDAPSIFCGDILHLIACQKYEDIEVLRFAKRLTRIAFKPLLAGKVLQSRELFRTPG